MAKTKYKTDSYPYQVYTALLTQSGGDAPTSIYSGELIIGATYSINDNFGSDSKTCFLDFSVLPYSWQMNDWMLVFDISNKEKCYLVSLTTTAIVEMEYNS